ncbi:TAT-variant-translocated molybdopterin oxidoreductase [Flavobacteriaceae bacterium F89]|uniref:TAT-variant-translocated molybdopterin oxidoreductase n=1 Tax=Cerina litoralis TaxID=2874477 RepID=A0AAE3EVB3_9FLAO|nr:TAT-variant-translocated molybdopterin oxidoreductase [Cerina litoralis]MCG2460326.1 TAT-variant-translocated molybdopterin oxidoreductase [Cerina litoralis]
MASSKKYWKSGAELDPNDSIVERLKQNEFVEEIPIDGFLGDKDTLDSTSTNRRDFLKFIGYSTAAASLAACEGPVVKTIPYVVQPERIIPGIANYYATTIADGFDFASILVKTREGRPIKIENNTYAKVNGAGKARVQASVLSLYDSTRLQGPSANGDAVEWSQFDTEVRAKLMAAKDSGRQIALLTQTYASPSTERLIADFKAAYGNVNHVIYDAVAEDAALNAFEAKYGERALADYDFENAALIVSFGADILGDWQGGGYDIGYAKGRIPKNGKMSRHIQFESNLTNSGAKADKRVPLSPSQLKLALAKLYGKLNNVPVAGELPSGAEEVLDSVAGQIRKTGSRAVVVTGLQDENAQTLVLALNEMLGSKVFDPQAPKYIRQGNAKAVTQLVADMKAGKVGALLMDGVNPMYTLPDPTDFSEGINKVGLSLIFALNYNETVAVSQYVASASHFLESWGDAQFKKGFYSLMQPTIKELFDTRQFQSSLLRWAGIDKTYYEYVKETWNTSILAGSDWDKALQDGVFVPAEMPIPEDAAPKEKPGAPAAEIAEAETVSTTIPIATAVNSLAGADPEGMELTLYTKQGLGDGQQASNPWLQEFPDPITRVSWGNYVTVSKVDADRLNLKNEHVSNGALNGSYVKLTVNGTTLEGVPVIIQPGQAKGSVGMALGYGRLEGMKSEMRTGVNAYPLFQDFSNIQSVEIEKMSGMHEFACVQLQNTMVGRGDDIIKETSLEIFNTKDKDHWNAVPKVDYNHGEIEVRDKNADIWNSFDTEIGHHFNLSIDLNACTGCGACVIACHAENNVPVVGKEEVRRFRDMHWLRVDRYYSSADTFKQEIEDLQNLPAMEPYTRIETASYENPEVAFQPVMCQHCNHAPCETVCPVAATSHGRQGQNQMVYNRCVGTRYCQNNCPYKVRRFNWFRYNGNDEFDYNMNNDLGRMVLNPDVVVRSRGVMEKCSMCIQLTQKTILDAKREGRKIEDGEFHTACSSACDKGAMVFGDINDSSSEILKKKNDDRMFHLLENVGTKPNVMYQVMVRNTTEA